MKSSTRYVYDTEFVETGREVFLISFGMVCEDGREYYAINSHMPVDKVANDPFLMENVVPFLPTTGTVTGQNGTLFQLDFLHVDVRPPSQIASEVLNFLAAGEHEPELWANYSAHDHVLFSRLWGDFKHRPGIVPMRTNDIAQEAITWQASGMPVQRRDNHHALADARHGLQLLRFIDLARSEWLLASALEHYRKFPGLFPGTPEWRRERGTQLVVPERS